MALEYSRRGWDTFPAPSDGSKWSLKSRNMPGCYKNWGATNNPQQIIQDAQRYPDSNNGLPTGYDQGFFVIETDTAAGHGEGVDGAASLAAWEVEHGITLPPTLMAKSPSGSIHRFYKYPTLADNYIKTQAGILSGVDVLGKAAWC